MVHVLSEFCSSQVMYTNWEPFAPDNWDGKQESCCEINRDTLMWNDYLCDDTGVNV